MPTVNRLKSSSPLLADEEVADAKAAAIPVTGWPKPVDWGQGIVKFCGGAAATVSAVERTPGQAGSFPR
jgi:hypothetical protein